MDAHDVRTLASLTDPERLRVLGALAGAAADAATLATTLHLPRRAVDRHLSHLRDLDLVRPAGPAGAFELQRDRLTVLARGLVELAASLGGAEGPRSEDSWSLGAVTPQESKVLRAYFVEGRLAAIPAQAWKRTIVLRELRARCFTEDRPYPEKEINQLLARFHPDVASLRRYLVDAGLVGRSGGMYWLVQEREMSGPEHA